MRTTILAYVFGLIIIVTGVVVSLGFGAFSFCSLGTKGEAGSLGLHVLNHDCSGDKCDLACDAGEKFASVTCPGGTIGLTKTGDTETASCTNTSGPILAICVRQ
jgi:hypothetical protein